MWFVSNDGLLANEGSTLGVARQQVFGDAVAATAILDRLLHHSQVITIRGDSYRLHDKRRSGLLQKAAAPTPITSES